LPNPPPDPTVALVAGMVVVVALAATAAFAGRGVLRLAAIGRPRRADRTRASSVHSGGSR
jgi:hypothetical protein